MTVICQIFFRKSLFLNPKTKVSKLFVLHFFLFDIKNSVEKFSQKLKKKNNYMLCTAVGVLFTTLNSICKNLIVTRKCS